MPVTTPLAFISSTREDLEEYRVAAKEAAIQLGFRPVMMDYFTAQSEKVPYSLCMAKVDPCDVLIAIVAHRYGWVPLDQPGSQQMNRSITWLECEHALNKKQKAEVLAFLVDENYDWPSRLYEAYRSTQAIEKGTDTPALITEVKRNVAKLKEFKQWLSQRGTYTLFSGPDDLRAKVLAALHAWLDRHPEFRTPASAHNNDPAKYLRWLREQTAWIDIRGLQVGTGKAHRFPIGDLYIPLKSLESSVDREIDKDIEAAVLLEKALSYQRLVITGDPGAGKTTFLRRIAYELSWESGKTELQLPHHGFPIFIRIAELEEHIRNCRAQLRTGAPTTKESPQWLMHFLEFQSQELHWNLGVDFFEEKLRQQFTTVLLDGLDEAVSRMHRESIARLVENVTDTYPDCRFVVTTRPGSYRGLGTLKQFFQVHIDNLETEGIERFLSRWSQSLYPDDKTGAADHCRQLLDALHARVEIRRMARNPVMLTALAVVHWNEKRLPEQRADLYESIVNWLARSREQRAGRIRSERCLALLGHLALGMQDQPNGRLTQVSMGRAAQIIASQFREIPKEERFSRAQTFLEEEEVDSGIVVSRGGEIRFWHLTFQEFLAARALSGFADATQQRVLFSENRLYRQQWREVLLLLAGILLVKQGAEKVDGLFEAVINKLGTTASLAAKAQCIGLLGTIVRDLRPLAYQPTDPRYQEILDAVLDVFEESKASAIEMHVRLEAALALGQVGDPRLEPEMQTRNWAAIPEGTFLMGAQSQDKKGPNYDISAKRNESPVHEVTLNKFNIRRYLVTVEEYERFIEDEGYQNESWWKEGEYGTWKKPGAWEEQQYHPNLPVVAISWYEAAAWCAWAGGRLPTEAEWERAARGINGRRHPWGNETPDQERGYSGEITGPTPVGLFPHRKTPEGIHDLEGNVLEWVMDWYSDNYYQKSPKACPTGPSQGAARVIRGSNWSLGESTNRNMRSANRDGFVPYVRNRYTGFRCVQVSRKPKQKI